MDNHKNHRRPASTKQESNWNSFIFLLSLPAKGWTRSIFKSCSIKLEIVEVYNPIPSMVRILKSTIMGTVLLFCGNHGNQERKNEERLPLWLGKIMREERMTNFLQKKEKETKEGKRKEDDDDFRIIIIPRIGKKVTTFTNYNAQRPALALFVGSCLLPDFVYWRKFVQSAVKVK